MAKIGLMGGGKMIKITDLVGCKVVAFCYLVLMIVIAFSGKQLTTNTVCLLLCLNMSVTYLFKKG